jgi:hypothetical protein
MSALLDDLAFVHHYDVICMSDSAKAVSYYNCSHCTSEVTSNTVDGCLYFLFIALVKSRGGLIE